MRQPLALVVASVALCGCLVPVSSTPADAGKTSSDSGTPVDGGTRRCAVARDCGAADGGFSFCTSPVRSCVDGQCLTECSFPARTCELTDGGRCLRCSDPSSASCAQCVRARRCSFTMGPSTCPSPFSAGTAFEVAPASTVCGGDIRVADGGASVGSWADLESGSQALLFIPALGGSCVATVLPTGAPRAAIACPACTFVEQGCE